HADPDPLDLGIIAGHGTRIASILGGVNGIAPGVELYAVRVCTSHTTLCSGVALIQGFDYLLDPNQDGYIDDAVDIVNLSIQAKQHSPFDMQVNEALENISRTGILTVGSAGNGFNHPYGTGMPGASTTVLTVGATASASTPYIIDSANRGPLFLNHLIKPELVAPSLVETAVAGSGQARDFNQETVAAVPIVAGNAAILMEAFPDRPWHEVKALLISTGEVDVYDSNTPARQFAPINLIGGGEIRIEQALNADVSIWDNRQPGTAVLSFGFQEVGRSTLALRKQIRVQNYTDAPVQYDLSTSFRFEDDDINGAVSIWTPRTIRVPANGAATFPVLMRINGNALRTWPPLSGQNSLTAVQLTELEYDGYIWLDDVSTTLDDQTPLHLAWHVLPRAVSDVVLELAQNEVILKNEGINQVDVSTYSLIGISSNRLDATNNGDVAPDLRYVGYSTILVPPGVCSDNSSFLFAFAINLWQPQIVPSASNGLLKIDIDTDQNGVVDYSVVKAGLDQFSPWPDQPLSWVVDWEADSATTQFYVDADMQSKNNILYACAEQIGMDATDYFNPIDLRITVIDKNGGEIEAIEGVTVSPLGEQYMAMFPPNDVGITSISPNSNDAMTVLDFGFLTNNSERGLLLLYGNGLNGPDAIAVELSP
ncbi:MAG: S8 family serine peptidase, partial [Chloroflexi bacterium]|nr:S8 family serine peptidase [Chloroflexota bacterium]